MGNSIIKIKTTLMLVFAIQLVLSSCSETRINNQVSSYMRQINTDLAENKSINREVYFTEKGWRTIKMNFNSDQGLKSFMSFLSNQRIHNIQRIDKGSFQVLLGEENDAGTYIGLVFIEETNKIRLDEYIAGK